MLGRGTLSRRYTLTASPEMVDHESNANAMTDPLLDAAEEALDKGDVWAAMDLGRRAVERSPESPRAHFVLGEILWEMTDAESAEERYRTVISLTRPDDSLHGKSWSALGWVLFDQLRFRESYAATLRAIRVRPLAPESYYVRAMLRERKGDVYGAKRDYLRAHRGEPERYPLPADLTDAMVEAVVQQVLRRLHPTVRAYLSQVPIILEDFPDDEVCSQYDPPALPGEVLGYFAGTSLAERSMLDSWTTLPSTIVLYRNNLARLFENREQLIHELTVTVFHEVGHYLGLDERELATRGLE